VEDEPTHSKLHLFVNYLFVSLDGAAQGLAITHSSYLKGGDFYALFELLVGDCRLTCASGCGYDDDDDDDDDKENSGNENALDALYIDADPRLVEFVPPILPLTWLDLTGNKLGDDASAKILDISLSCGCLLEALDLSNNNIKAGTSVIKVLERFQRNRRGGIRLKQLLLRDNNLRLGVVTTLLDICSVKSDEGGLGLKVLSLRRNGFDGNEVGVKKSVRQLLGRGTSLVELDLGGNCFNMEGVNNVLFGLLENLNPTITLVS